MDVPQIAAGCLSDIVEAAGALNPGDGMSPHVLHAIVRHAEGRDIRRSVETGAGGSTLLFSHLSARHTAFTVQGDGAIITRIRSSLLFRPEYADFVEGPTQRTLPPHIFDQPLDAALIDGPHAFPFPQLEYFYLYPHLSIGGLLIVDDIHIRTVHEFYRFLRKDAMFELIDVVDRTAFFRRTSAPVFDPWGDGWWAQFYNRRPLFGYTWRETGKKLLPVRLRENLREIQTGWRRSIRIEEPASGHTVAGMARVRGRAKLSPQARLWIFARRADLSGWWPQGDGPAIVSEGKWEQICKFGEAGDAGREFDIAVLALDEVKHQRVLRWFIESGRLGRWGPTPLPEPMAGTSIARTRVVRAE